jgi:hypothetical protein
MNAVLESRGRIQQPRHNARHYKTTVTHFIVGVLGELRDQHSDAIKIFIFCSKANLRCDVFDVDISPSKESLQMTVQRTDPYNSDEASDGTIKGF